MALETRVLIADADSTIRDIIKISAMEQGWMVDEVGDGITALKGFRRTQYHLAILDTDLPDIDGKLVCRYLRKNSKLPVIFISRSGNEADKLAGFAVGGNDYMVKPFYPRELIARAKNLLTLCGHHSSASKEIEIGPFHVDLSSRVIYVDGRRLQLTPKEYDLLLFFCQNPGQAFSRDALLDLVWGEEFFGSDRTVDTHIKTLRSRIAPHQGTIVTIWGYGYKFEPEARSG